MTERYIEIGEKLRNARLKKNLTLEKISTKTNISIQHLHNIEEGNFHLLPGKFYEKSFIKAYCTALRVSISKYLSIYESESTLKTASYETNDNKSPIISEKIPTIPIVIIASIGLISFFILNFISVNNNTEEKMAVIPPKPKANLIKIEENIMDDIEDLKQESDIKQTNLNLKDLNKDYENKSILSNKQIIAKNDVWIEIKDFDENILISTILNRNETFNLPENNNNIVISTSDAGSLYLKNGNDHTTNLGSSGAILESVQLHTLITNH